MVVLCVGGWWEYVMMTTDERTDKRMMCSIKP